MYNQILMTEWTVVTGSTYRVLKVGFLGINALYKNSGKSNYKNKVTQAVTVPNETRKFKMQY